MSWKILLIVYLYKRMSRSERILLRQAMADVVLEGKRVNEFGELK